MARHYHLDFFVLESSHLYLAFVDVRDGQHSRAVLRVWVESTQSIGVGRSIEAIDKREIREIIHVNLVVEYYHHSGHKIGVSPTEILTCPCVA